MSSNDEKAVTADTKPFTENVHIEQMPQLKHADGWDQLRQDAIDAEEAETNMGLWESLRTYPTAVFWSFAISLVIIMEGYDTARE